MKRTVKYLRQWMDDVRLISKSEMRHIFSDSGVLVIFFLAGLLYPVLYGLIYRNDSVENMPVAVVDGSCSAESRDFLRAVDATRELSVSYSCTDMAEAEMLMRQRKVNGIVMIPQDFADRLAAKEQTAVSIYADMSSFLYYKNLTMGVNMVMLDRMHKIQASRFSAAGFSARQTEQLVQPVKYEANVPYNRNFSYSLFFLSAVLLIIIQQTMFYGISMLTGTMREENRSFSVLPDGLQGHGISRTVLGRGAAYWLLYIGIGIYVAVIVPRMIGMPHNCPFGEIFILLLFYVTACVGFSFTFSTFIRHRETVIVIFLMMSPICLFLTGFSWPQSSFPVFWRLFSYIFPSTFAVRAFINMNTAGASLAMCSGEFLALAVQTAVYYALSCLAAYLENRRTAISRG